jgi:hypothetical protein
MLPEPELHHLSSCSSLYGRPRNGVFRRLVSYRQLLTWNRNTVPYYPQIIGLQVFTNHEFLDLRQDRSLKMKNRKQQAGIQT